MVLVVIWVYAVSFPRILTEQSSLIAYEWLIRWSSIWIWRGLLSGDPWLSPRDLAWGKMVHRRLIYHLWRVPRPLLNNGEISEDDIGRQMAAAYTCSSSRKTCRLSVSLRHARSSEEIHVGENEDDGHHDDAENDAKLLSCGQAVPSETVGGLALIKCQYRGFELLWRKFRLTRW